MDKLADEQLMIQIMAGNKTALAILVERHYSAVFYYLYRLTGANRALAEDLAQDTFVRLVTQASYRVEKPFKPWLFTIATNLLRDYFKSAAVTHAQPQSKVEWLEFEDTKPGPEELALLSEQGRQIAEAIGQLSEEYRSALILRFYQGFSLAEIAQVLQIPLGTVKSRLSVGQGLCAWKILNSTFMLLCQNSSRNEARLNSEKFKRITPVRSAVVNCVIYLKPGRKPTSE